MLACKGIVQSFTWADLLRICSVFPFGYISIDIIFASALAPQYLFHTLTFHHNAFICSYAHRLRASGLIAIIHVQAATLT